MSERVVVVVSGGEPLDPHAALAVPAGAPVVAADSGLDSALALGLDVTVATGDFDSASPEAVVAAEASGVRIERHPAEKDATDLELALDTAAAMTPDRILVLAGRGAAGSTTSSCGPPAPRLGALRDDDVDALVGDARVHVIRGERELAGWPGELLTLVAVNGPAVGVTTDGLEYPLRGETLEPGSSRGVSNVFEGDTARVTVESGVLLAIRPGESA